MSDWQKLGEAVENLKQAIYKELEPVMLPVLDLLKKLFPNA
jgi:hypothetical protein